MLCVSEIRCDVYIMCQESHYVGTYIHIYIQTNKQTYIHTYIHTYLTMQVKWIGKTEVLMWTCLLQQLIDTIQLH